MRLLKLIQLYFYVCEVYKEELKWHCQRFTKNQVAPEFTDEELITSFLHGVGQERLLQVKDVYEGIKAHYLDCFPRLPTYKAYNARLNRLAAVFPVLVRCLLEKWQAELPDEDLPFSLTDSMPIITCSSKRRARVARELCDKGYNSTKQMHFYGMKLHVIGWAHKGRLPQPEFMQLGAASQNDLEAQREWLKWMSARTVLADKAFVDQQLQHLFQQQGGALLTPVKYKRNQPLEDRQRHLAADTWCSKWVSSIKQPMESLFSWLIQHVDLQRASKVRSAQGLIVHVFGKIAAVIASKTPALGQI